MPKKTEPNHSNTASSNKKEPSEAVTQINDSAEVIPDNQVKKINSQAIELEVGSKINRITIEKLLGKGGMGAVYLGYDEKLKRKVAIKSIRPEHLANPSTHERFIREAQILSKINHPSICHIYDYIETQDGDYLVLEYIQGKELNQVTLSKEGLIVALYDLAKGLAAAHKHGIVHRDLKPDNIMVNNDGKVKILDFGIAQSISQPKHRTETTEHEPQNTSLTQQGSLVGTIRYMSPEQARGDSISTASDIYSLGIIIQELFSQNSAYPVMETEQLLHDVQLGNRISSKDVPGPFQGLIDQFCQTDANKRPSAIEAASEINKIRLAPITKRKRTLYAFIGLTVFVLVGLSSFQWFKSQMQQQSAELARSYTQTINSLVKDSEQVYVLPIHNVKDEITEIIQFAQELILKIEQDPNLNELDKIKLQGLIYLEAEEYELAIELFEKVDANHYLLARAWMALYIEKAGEYAEIHGIEQTLKSQEFRDQYLQPALKYIQSSTQNDDVMHAFKISQTQSLEAGLELLDEILDKQKWNKRAIDLKSQILMAQAENSLQKGKWNEATKFYTLTAKTYEDAIQMARSYPENYVNLCQVRGILLFDGIQRTGENIEENFQAAIQSCKEYLITIPEESFTINLISKLHTLLGHWQLRNGLTAKESLNQAINWNQKSLNLQQDPNTYWTKALIHLGLAAASKSSNKETQQELELAQTEFSKVELFVDAIPAYLYADKIYALSLQIELNIKTDKDISKEIFLAEEYFQSAINSPNLDISEKRLLNLQLGVVYFLQLQKAYIAGNNIEEKANKLIQFYQKSTSEVVDEINLILSLTNVQLLLAEYKIEKSQPFEPILNSANDNIDKAITLEPNKTDTLLAQAKYHSLLAHTSHHDFSKANQLFQEAINSSPNNAYANYSWAKSFIKQVQLSTSLSEKQSLTKAALQKINSALKADPNNKVYLAIKNRLNF